MPSTSYHGLGVDCSRCHGRGLLAVSPHKWSFGANWFTAHAKQIKVTNQIVVLGGDTAEIHAHVERFRADQNYRPDFGTLKNSPAYHN